jgi:predicted naringenin-chalcone synthase
MLLARFHVTPPRHRIAQATSLHWLAHAHEPDDARAERLARIVARFACQIDSRGHSIDEVAEDRRDGVLFGGLAPRMARFAALVDDYFTDTYADDDAPDDLVHVTCTGYASPSSAQKLVARRGWDTRVTHAYHMGCYAAIPALRIAAGMLATGSRRVDLAHTELCSLHFDPREHATEQLVVQTLFADGLIRYVAVREAPHGLRVLALHERVLPDSAAAMTWTVGDRTFQMTLARDIPERVGDVLRDFVIALYRRAGLDVGRVRDSVFAVHPGGPKILDRVEAVLELAPEQMEASRAVLREHGNMSSATVPHVWARLFADDRVPVATPIATLAFGPGLTVCGALLEKR